MWVLLMCLFLCVSNSTSTPTLTQICPFLMFLILTIALKSLAAPLSCKPNLIQLLYYFCHIQSLI